MPCDASAVPCDEMWRLTPGRSPPSASEERRRQGAEIAVAALALRAAKLAAGCGNAGAESCLGQPGRRAGGGSHTWLPP